MGGHPSSVEIVLTKYMLGVICITYGVFASKRHEDNVQHTTATCLSFAMWVVMT